jgi:hypothetical protein
MHVLQKRSIEPDAASRLFAIIIFLFLSFYYGTGLCLLEWCGDAVRDFQARNLSGRSSDLRP